MLVGIKLMYRYKNQLHLKKCFFFSKSFIWRTVFCLIPISSRIKWKVSFEHTKYAHYIAANSFEETKMKGSALVPVIKWQVFNGSNQDGVKCIFCVFCTVLHKANKKYWKIWWKIVIIMMLQSIQAHNIIIHEYKNNL